LRVATWLGGVADKAPKAPSSAYFEPSCAPGAPRFAEVGQGKWLDPRSLPVVDSVAAQPAPVLVNLPADLPTVDVDALDLAPYLLDVIRDGPDADPERYDDRSEPEFFVSAR
jgi:hypothetical protein